MMVICARMWDPAHALHDLEATTRHMVAITAASPSAWAFSCLLGNMAAILCMEMGTRAEANRDGAAQELCMVPKGLVGRQDTVRRHSCPSQGLSPLCWLGSKAATGHPEARTSMALSILKHWISRDLEVATGKHSSVLKATNKHQRSTSDPGEKHYCTMGQTKLLLDTPNTNTRYLEVLQHPQTLSEHHCTQPQCSIPNWPYSPHKQHNGCPTPPTIPPHPLTSQLLLPNQDSTQLPELQEGFSLPSPCIYSLQVPHTPQQHEPHLRTLQQAGNGDGWGVFRANLASPGSKTFQSTLR